MLHASQNLIKDLKKQSRENGHLLFLDNIKIIKDAIFSGLLPKLVLIDEAKASSLQEKLGFLSEKQDGDFPVYVTESRNIEALSASKTPQGVICVVELDTSGKNFVPEGVFLVLDGVQDPGNVGTLIRTAVACNIKQVVLLEGARPANPKVVRSSAGTVFAVDIFELSRAEFVKMFGFNALASAKKPQIASKISLVKCDLEGENMFEASFDCERPLGIVVGSEGQGLSEEVAKICSRSVKIPMSAAVESLNVGVAGSLVMYHICGKAL